MGAIKSYLHNWLEEYGFNLGYDMSNAPEFEDMDWVADDNIDAEAYWKQRKEKDNE